jgi:hypothetical protein
MNAPQWNDYEYVPPEYLADRAEQGYSQSEKLSMFEYSSIPSIMQILQKQQQQDAVYGASGTTGGIQAKSKARDADTNALALNSVWQSVEDASQRAQENAMSQIYQLESQYKTTMMNRDLSLAQMEQQKDLSNKQMWATIGGGLLSLIP